MIFVDTMVAVELLKASPDPAVLAWAGQAPRAEVCIASVTEGELLFGAEDLPEGRRKREYRSRLDRYIAEVLAGRVFPFDRTAAAFYAEFAVMRRKAGRTTKRNDAMIAATARARGARLIATRDFGHFDGCGVSLVNPWDASCRVLPALRVLPGGSGP